MKKTIGFLILLSISVVLLAACASTPEPTEPPPTQTPRIVIVTTTPCAEVAQIEASPQVVTVVVTATPTKPKPATPAPTATAVPSPQETPATEQPAPTQTPAEAEFKYPPPVLIEPPNNRPVSWGSTVLLIWDSVGELAEDEYYHVHLERPPKPGTQQEWYGDYIYTKETQFLVEGAFLAPFHLPQDQGYGVVYWWVRVVRKTGEDENGKPIGVDLSPPSEKRTFITEPKPG